MKVQSSIPTHFRTPHRAQHRTLQILTASKHATDGLFVLKGKKGEQNANYTHLNWSWSIHLQNKLIMTQTNHMHMWTRAQITNINSMCAFTCWHGKKQTALGVALQVLPTNSKLIPRLWVPSHQSLCRGTEDALPTKKAEAMLRSSGCHWLVERDLGASGSLCKAQQLRGSSVSRVLAWHYLLLWFLLWQLVIKKKIKLFLGVCMKS